MTHYVDDANSINIEYILDEFIDHLTVKGYQNIDGKEVSDYVKEYDDVRVQISEITRSFSTPHSTQNKSIKLTTYQLLIDHKQFKCLTVTNVNGNNEKLVIKVISKAS